MKAEDFIGPEVIYDPSGQIIWGKKEKGELQMIADIRGWGAIQNLFKRPDKSIDFEKASAFQDEVGEWIADAINQKLNNAPKATPLSPPTHN